MKLCALHCQGTDEVYPRSDLSEMKIMGTQSPRGFGFGGPVVKNWPGSIEMQEIRGSNPWVLETLRRQTPLQYSC